MAYKKIC